MKKKRKIVWFAKGGGIAKMGPYSNQIEATNALRLDDAPRVPWAEKSNALFPADAFVWPELKEDES